MGNIRDDFGNITIETRRESFIIHADFVSGQPHPEFDNADAADLVAALLDAFPDAAQHESASEGS